MKKAISLLLALVLCLSLCACGKGTEDGGEQTTAAESKVEELNLVQEWRTISDGQTVSFDAEGYFHINSGAYKYEYDEDASMVRIDAGIQINCPVSLVDGVYRILVDGEEIAPASEYERLHAEYARTMVVIPGFDGTPALNAVLVADHIDRIELTVDNWSDYLKVYQYDVVKVEKDAFDEVISTETESVTRLGFGTEQYYCLDATIELQHKETGEFITYSGTGHDFVLRDPIDLEEYECTRIKGYLYFFDFTEEVMDEVLNKYDSWNTNNGNAEIQVTSSGLERTWRVDCEGKVIENASGSWSNYFE